MATEAQGPVLRALWRDKMHVEPGVLERAPATVRGRLEHIWEPAELLMRELQALPLGLLSAWAQCSRGHILFTHERSRYQPGPHAWAHGTLESVCYLSVRDLLDDPSAALSALFHLLDHLLGSEARLGEPPFSAGTGFNAHLGEAAGRFLAIHALGYGHEDLGVPGPEDYFVRTLLLYLRHPQRLSVLDPPLYRLYRHTLFDDGFWRRADAS